MLGSQAVVDEVDDIDGVEAEEIDEETKAKIKEIEEGEMRPELKFLDKKWTDKGT